MGHSLTSFEIQVETESCLFLISDPRLRIVAYETLSKDDKIVLASP